MTIEAKQLEMIRNRKNYGNEQKTEDLPVWTLSKFIEMRAEFCTDIVNSKKSIALYTELYSCITSFVVNSVNPKL
jgi:hypothetical protein